MGKVSFSVVIPTLNAAQELPVLLNAIDQQSVAPAEIIVVDSSSDDNTEQIALCDHRVTLLNIARGEFNHGTTRDFALRQTTGEFVCFLTQDAVPFDNEYFEKLLKPLLMDPSVGLSSGRQVPKDDARKFERLVRAFNYPDRSSVKTMADLSDLGIKTFFASDVCSAYRRSAYLECGGFSAVNTNEDMLMAAKLIRNGWGVAYEATAQVLHSHNLSPAEQFKRNYEVGRFLKSHKDDLMGVGEIGEGAALVKSVMARLVSDREYSEAAAFIVDCVARLLGNKFGKISLSAKDGKGRSQ